MRVRYEFKYRLSPAQAEKIEHWADLTMTADSHGDRGRYCVNSLYFDTPNWSDARASHEGIEKRSKFRVRTYGRNDPSSPFFFERKIKNGSAVSKRRVKCPLGCSSNLAQHLGSDQELPWMTLTEQAPESDLAQLNEMRSLIELRRMTPSLWIRYDRQAWLSPFGDGSRLTLDRDVEAAEPLLASNLEGDGWRFADSDPRTILELKFNDTYPRWMHDMVQTLQLDRLSCSKYGIAAATTPEYHG